MDRGRYAWIKARHVVCGETFFVFFILIHRQWGTSALSACVYQHELGVLRRRFFGFGDGPRWQQDLWDGRGDERAAKRPGLQYTRAKNPEFAFSVLPGESPRVGKTKQVTGVTAAASPGTAEVQHLHAGPGRPDGLLLRVPTARYHLEFHPREEAGATA